jgi:hypothetical protein
MAKIQLTQIALIRGLIHGFRMLVTTGHIVHCAHGIVELLLYANLIEISWWGWIALDFILLILSARELIRLMKVARRANRHSTTVVVMSTVTDPCPSPRPAELDAAATKQAPITSSRDGKNPD